MIQKTPASPRLNGSGKTKGRVWSGQVKVCNQIEMHDLKQAVHVQKPSNVVEFKQFCKDE